MDDYSNQMLGAAFQAKLAYRFVVVIDGLPMFLATKASRPTWKTAQVEYNFINSKRYGAGKMQWDTIDITIVDAYEPSGAQWVMAWLRSQYEPISGRAAYMDNYRRPFEIHVLSPGGTTVQTWKFVNAFITNASFGDLDMTDDSTPLEIVLTIRFDKAIMQF